jgi:hypothetical protein
MRLLLGQGEFLLIRYEKKVMNVLNDNCNFFYLKT